MSQLDAIRKEVIAMSKQLRKALHADARCVAISEPLRNGVRKGWTEGHYVELGRLGRRIRVDLWIDHYAHTPTPRAWFGVASYATDLVKRISKAPALKSLSKKIVRRTSRDVAEYGKYYRFAKPLKSDEFDLLVHEHYAGEESYLGVFLSYPWPFNARTRAAVGRDVGNLASLFCAAYAELDVRPRKGIHTVGPWARPDPKIERHAVRHVKRYLVKKGFAVKSREREVCGYDLHAVSPSEELHIEVKGCAGGVRRFFISRTELNASQVDPLWRLAVITCASTQPCKPTFLRGGQMRGRFSLEPTQWLGTEATRALTATTRMRE
jgi:uncharacterized protein DUF3883